LTFAATPYGCHDRGKMEDKHKEITSNLGSCATCHPGGKEDGD